MNLSFKNVMKMLKDPKNCAIITVVVLLLVVGGFYMYKKSCEGFQVPTQDSPDNENPYTKCESNQCYDRDLVECSEIMEKGCEEQGCYDDETLAMAPQTTMASDPTTMASDPTTMASDPTTMASDLTTTSM